MLGSSPPPSSQPFFLKEGFWEETVVCPSASHGRIVRKAIKPTAEGPDAPWASETLRKEIAYLQSLPESLRPFFPPVLDAWGTRRSSETLPGYEMPYYPDRIDVARRMATTEVPHREAEAFQDRLAEILFQNLYQPSAASDPSLATHLRDTLGSVAEQLSQSEIFQPLVAGRQALRVNGCAALGLLPVLERLEDSDLWPRMEGLEIVQLHGDLILENILCPTDAASWWTDCLFIDPVSVAGIGHGPALFDLVKYESYASGELPAMRAERCHAGLESVHHYGFHWDHRSPALAPYAEGRWHGRFRNHFEVCYGPVDLDLYRVLEAYFALVMAVNTSGVQQWARLIKGVQTLNLILAQ